KRILENNEAGTCAPYIMLGQKVVLRELYFTSGPAKYCMVYDIFDDYIGLIIVHPETPDGMTAVFDLETSYFSQGQGNQGFERRRSPLRRTIQTRRLTQRLRKRAVSGRKPARS
ncbi:MAG: hypothetical protein ACSLFH_06070, partial [Desulfuromonadales bacterium]